MFGFWFCWGQQVSIAGYILNNVHEGGAGVRTGSDVNNVAGAAQLKPGLSLLIHTECKNMYIYCICIYIYINIILTNISDVSSCDFLIFFLPAFHLLQVWQQ